MQAAAFEPTSFLWMILFALGGGAGLPLGIPPGPEPPVLARVAPEECLFYTAWSGMAAPDPQSKNQTEQLLAEPEVRQLWARVEQLFKDTVVRESGPHGSKKDVEELLGWAKLILTRPVVAFVSSAKMGPNGPDVRGAAVVQVGEKILEFSAAIEKYQKSLLQLADENVRIANGDWHRLKLPPGAPVVVWGTVGQSLVIGVGEGEVEGVLQRARGTPPKWLVALHQQLPVDRRAATTYVNLKTLRETLLPLAPDPRVRDVLEAAGLGNVTSIGSVTGLDANGFVGKSLIGIEGEPAGIFQTVGKPLAPKDLAPIPRDATIAVAVKFDLDRLFETALAVASKVDPNVRQGIEAGLGMMQVTLGFNVRDDLVKSLGDVWCLYNSPGEGGLVVTGLTVVVQVKEHEKLAKVQEKLLAMAKSMMTKMVEDFGGPPQVVGRGPAFVPMRIDQFQHAGQTIHSFRGGRQLPLAPSWCLTEKELIVSMSSQNIKAYLSRGADYESLAKSPEVAGLFEGDAGPVKLVYVDTRSVAELVYPLLQFVVRDMVNELQRRGIEADVSMLPSAPAILKHLRPATMAARRTAAGFEIVNRQTVPGVSVGGSIPMAIALALPALQSARGSARRVASVNNLKQIGLALHNTHDVYKAFPAAYSTDKEGKPLLSWRVKILPFVEASALYQQFHLDEPWDSEHNKKLIAQMPSVYRSPTSKAAPGKTTYLAVRGEHAVFPGAKPVGIAQITDGTSNTIMVVEVPDESAVIWTKPDDFQFDRDNPLKGLLGPQSQGFSALFADGSVRVLNAKIDLKILRCLFDRDDGQPVGKY